MGESRIEPSTTRLRYIINYLDFQGQNIAYLLQNEIKNIFQLYSFVESRYIFPDVISRFSALLHEDTEHLIEKIILSTCQSHQIIPQSYSNRLSTHHLV